MLRKLLMVTAAAAIPLGAVALGTGTATAKAPPPPSPPLNCSASGSVTFAPPGISHYGSAEVSKDSTTVSSALTFAGANCGTGGTSPTRNIVSKATLKCNKKIAGEDATGATMPSCVPGDVVYDSAGGFASTGTATLQKALKKLTFAVNGITFSAKTTSSGFDLSCGGTEVGFVLSGTVKAKPYTYSTFTLTACLGTDSGTGTTGSFGTDLGTAASNSPINSTIQIATTDIDSASSSLAIS